MGGVCSCSSVIPKYASHIAALYPDPRSPDEMRTLGGVLQQEDCRHWKLRGSASDLVSYCIAFPSKVAPTAALLAKNVRKDLARGRLRHAAVGMLALHALVSGAHSEELLPLYEASVINSMILCFEHSNAEIQILAAQLLCTMLTVQSPSALGSAASTGASGAAPRSYLSHSGSGVDFAKFAVFYPLVLAMATRNPPPRSKIAQLIAAMESGGHSDDKQGAAGGGGGGGGDSDSEKDSAGSGGGGGGSGGGGGKKQRRVKDIAELEHAAAPSITAQNERHAHHSHHHHHAPASAASSAGGIGGGGADKDKDSNKDSKRDDNLLSEIGGALGGSSDASSSALKLHISLWRSRYFGLKALDTLLRLNRDWRASLAVLNSGDLLPSLLCNFPKSKKALRSVVAELDSGALGTIDEAWKYWSSSAEKEKLEAARERAERDEKQAAKAQEKAEKEGGVANKHKMIEQAAAAEKARSALEALETPPATFREELAAKTGITLHTVQLMSYAAFRALCKVPGLEMHIPALVAGTAKWLDQHQRTTVQTTLSGAVIQPTSSAPAVAAAAGSGEDAKHSHHRKDSDDGARGDDAPVPLDSLPYGWENLHFASHLFADLIAKEVALESGSIDQIVGGLLNHLADIEALNAPANVAAAGAITASSAGSRRGSKNEQAASAAAEGAAVGTAPQPAGAAPKSDGASDSAPGSAAAGSGKTTLAQDFKLLFEKKKKTGGGGGRVSLLSGRNPRLAQIAIVHVINSVLNQPSNLRARDTAGFDAMDPEANGGGLCLMNYQILLDSFVSLVLGAVRSRDLAAKAAASGHADLLQQPAHPPHLQQQQSSNGAGGDHDVLEAERALDANLLHATEFLRLLTTVTPSLLIQRFYSFNDILQSITLVLQLALVRPANRPLKAALIDVAYSMSLGMLRWGSSGGGLDDEGSKGSASPLTEKQNESRGKGFGGGKRTRFTEGPARMQFEDTNSASNMTSSALYESLLHAVLGSIACETDVAARAQSYKILQAVLMCMSGFGGGWGNFPSPASAQAAAQLLRHSSAASAAGFAFTNLNSMAMVGLTRGNTSGASVDLGSNANNGGNQLAYRSSSSLLSNGGDNAGEEYKHSVAAAGLDRQPTSSLAVPAESVAEEQSVVASDNGVGLESSPSPVHAHMHGHGNGGGRGSSPSLNGALSASSLDLRALRIPQILASCMDIQSAIAAPSGSAAGASGAGASSARGGARGSSGGAAAGLFFPAALATTGPMAAVSMQDHKWILSIIYYELTSSFSADSSPAPAAEPSASSKAVQEPSAYTLASSIIKAKGRGATSNENISLCFQLLILLLLQKHPDQQQQLQAESSSLNAIQTMLGLQLPLLFSLLAFLRSAQSEDKFALPVAASLRLHAFTTSYFLFVSKLMLMSAGIESHWIRQASVGLEEIMRDVLSTRSRNQEGLGGELEANLMFGLVEVSPSEPATEVRTHIDLEALAAVMAKMLVDPPASDAPSTTRAQQTSSSVQDPSMDEHMDARLSEQRAFLLDSNSFEPFSLKYLLPEKSPARFVFRGVGGGGFAAVGNEASERENSVSWAPSAMGGGADEPAVAAGGAGGNELPTGRVGSFFGAGEMHGDEGLLAAQQATPRPQGTSGQPLGSPSLHLPSATSSAPNSSASGSGLSSVPQSPVAPQSLEEMMAEMDQQSFQKLASKCSKTTARSREEFTLFMTELECATPAAATAAAAGRRASDAAAAAAASERFRAAAGGGKLNNAADAPASPELKPAAAPRPAVSQPNPSPESVDDEKKTALNGYPAVSSSSSSLDNLLVVESVSASHPDLAVMRPLSASTLELQFPQLASFDLYLHSEIE